MRGVAALILFISIPCYAGRICFVSAERRHAIRQKILESTIEEGIRVKIDNYFILKRSYDVKTSKKASVSANDFDIESFTFELSGDKEKIDGVLDELFKATEEYNSLDDSWDILAGTVQDFGSREVKLLKEPITLKCGTE